jgi:hypothetical protein
MNWHIIQLPAGTLSLQPIKALRLQILTGHQVKMQRGDISPDDETLVGLFNDDINSAVEFLRHGKIGDAAARDIIVVMLQTQDSLDLFARFKNNVEKRLNFDKEEVERIFACHKIAEIFANGRWVWKRERYRSSTNPNYQGFLQFDRVKGLLEDFPFIISLIVGGLKKADIKPDLYINRLNEIFKEDSSQFMELIKKLQNGTPTAVCDEIYLYLLRAKTVSRVELESLLEAILFK